MTRPVEHPATDSDQAALRALLDRVGRLWRWNPTLSRRPGEPPGVFCHAGARRTEREIEFEAEPIIVVRDPHLLVARLEPVPARQIQLNDWIVLPVRGELAPVIGIYPCPDRYTARRWICTDNGDWARRADTSSVLRADQPPPWPDPPDTSRSRTAVGAAWSTDLSPATAETILKE
jgi:hypothetical protein